MPCATHAWLTLQGQDRGRYVVRASYSPEFLTQWFGAPGKGDLYDAATGGDLRPGMEKDQGDEGDDAHLKELIAACENPDPEARRIALEAVADLPAWRSLIVAEVLLGHWDGYALAANNYLLYRRPLAGRFVVMLPLEPTVNTVGRALLRSSTARTARSSRLSLVSPAAAPTPKARDRMKRTAIS